MNVIQLLKADASFGYAQPFDKLRVTTHIEQFEYIQKLMHMSSAIFLYDLHLRSSMYKRSCVFSGEFSE